MPSERTHRPAVFDYDDPVEFCRDLGEYHRQTRRSFSVRARAKGLRGCSPALVSQVLNGKRKLKRDQLLNFAKVFLINATEVEYLDELLKSNRAEIGITNRGPRVTKNHLLTEWLNPYVKDLVELEGFRLDARWIAQYLAQLTGQLVTVAKVQKTIEFLLREGFWRKTPGGQVVLEEPAAVTTNEIPNEKIRSFHRQALKIALKGLEELPMARRKASTILVSVNAETCEDLRSIINKFQNDLTEFIERHPKEKTELVQITVHMTSLGDKNA